MTKHDSYETLGFQGMRIGRYEVIRRIAVGGMAEIYLATDSAVASVNRTVVVKCILPSISSDPSFVELFLDEIRIVARLSHQNIAHVYDFGEINGLYFIAMEYIDGLHVSQLVRGLYPDLMPIEHAVKIGSIVAEALYHAHNLTDEDGRRLGIIHRDVSPENIMISQDGQVKLVDFGVARAKDQVHHTQVGILRGKAAYLSPEQCMGMPFDHRVDVFSLGTVLHEMLCGRRLFKRETDFKTMQAVCKGSIVPPSRVRPGVSQRLDEIVLRALSRDASDRYQQADELSVDLEQVLHEEHLLSNQIMLGRFVLSVLDRGETLRESISGEDQAELAGDGNGSHSGVRISTERRISRQRADATIETGRRRHRASKSQPQELALALDLDDALGELSGSDLGVAAYFSDTQDHYADESGEPIPRRKSSSFEIDINEALLSSDDSFSTSLAETAQPSHLDDVPSGLARSMTAVDRGVLGRRGPSHFSTTAESADVRTTAEVEVIKARAEPPGAKRDDGEPPWTVQIVPREAAERDVRRGSDQASPVKVVQPVHLGKPTEGWNVVSSGSGVQRPIVKDQGIEEGRIVLVTSDSHAHPLGNIPLLDLSSIPGADLRHDLDDFDDEVETNVWKPYQQRDRSSTDGYLNSAESGLVASLPTGHLPVHSRWLARYRVHAILGLALVATLVTIIVLWPRSSDRVQSPQQDDDSAMSKTGTKSRPVPSAIPSSDLQTQKGTSSAPPQSSETGALVLRVNNVDTVIVDDLMVTPAEARSGVSLNPGEHTVRVIRPRHRPWARRFDVAAGTRLQLTARPKRAGRRWGRLTIESDEGSEVYIAGLLLGRTPVSDMVLWPGPHEVKLVADDGREARQEVTVQRGKASDLYLEKSAYLDSARAAKSASGAKGRHQKTQLSPRGKLPTTAAIGRARTCFENADYECCVESLEGLEEQPSAVNLLITCFSAAGHIDDACAVARLYPSSRTCSQFVSRRCRDREPR